MSQPKRKLSPRDYQEIADDVLAFIADNHPEDLDYIKSHIQQIIEDPSMLSKLLNFKHMPVDPYTFMTSPAYMNKPKALWPEVMKCFVELNSGKYTECILTGAIGVGKTQLALYTQAYQLYVLSCMRNPHEVFGLDSASEIIIVIQSLNKDLAKSVDYARFRTMIKDSPYFTAHFPFDQSIESEMRFPNSIRLKPISGEDTGAIGQNVIGGIIDEINFMAVTEKSKKSRDNEVYDQAIKNYNSIASRRNSRFMKPGQLPGMLCLVSSRNYPGQFTDKKEEEAKKNPRIYVYDKRVWEIKPWDFTGEMFWLYTGDATRKPYLDPKPSKLPEEERALCMQIPIEFREQFERDTLNAIREVAGLATVALHPFILNTDAIRLCFGKVTSIASREECDFLNTKIKVFPKRIANPFEPRLAHIDLAFAKDSAGITIGHIHGFKKINRGDHTEMWPMIQADMILEVQVPKGGEIEFSNIRKLLYTLRDKIGLPIKWITFDGFQSRDSMQILHQQGFIVDYTSMDKDTTGYDFLKQAIYDERLSLPAHAKCQRELVALEINVKDGIIDHPQHGSKDVSDSLAGVVYGLTIVRENWIRHGVPLHNAPNLMTFRNTGEATKVKAVQGEVAEVDNGGL